MIEQIKGFIAEWNWEGIAEDLDTKEQREAIAELEKSCRYLIGEVERLQHERDNALSLRNISVKHYNAVKQENEMLQRELAEYREEEDMQLSG